MPIEIKELHIRVLINTAPTGQRSKGTTSAVGNGSIGDDSVKDAIVSECVEQVLQVIKNKAER